MFSMCCSRVGGGVAVVTFVVSHSCSGVCDRVLSCAVKNGASHAGSIGMIQCNRSQFGSPGWHPCGHLSLDARIEALAASARHRSVSAISCRRVIRASSRIRSTEVSSGSIRFLSSTSREFPAYDFRTRAVSLDEERFFLRPSVREDDLPLFFSKSKRACFLGMVDLLLDLLANPVHQHIEVSFETQMRERQSVYNSIMIVEPVSTLFDCLTRDDSIVEEFTCSNIEGCLKDHLTITSFRTRFPSGVMRRSKYGMRGFISHG